eukprot:CAMPEP_0172803966 /NCGR_PEP_ID=MMETSP1075-20121228/4853_1 /TAXON_ID=2916 /ORGANISM="Ceratium fusus, Strain PA161109" /LENGTH=131 /DNA_ID=CAMNT_0013642471 /DNA_START=1 /DNA_END=391 /DNA_ORIENTATION=-
MQGQPHTAVTLMKMETGRTAPVAHNCTLVKVRPDMAHNYESLGEQAIAATAQRRRQCWLFALGATIGSSLVLLLFLLRYHALAADSGQAETAAFVAAFLHHQQQQRGTGMILMVILPGTIALEYSGQEEAA